MSDLKQTITDAFVQYSGAVLQSRALVDARDCLKPSARQIFYSMYSHKLTHTNSFKKTVNAVGSVEKFTGKIMAVVHRNDDVEEKWIVAPEGMTFTKEEIREQIHFQEQYFDSKIMM